MSAKSRPENTSITKQLTDHPERYHFKQAIRIIERSTVFGKQSKRAAKSNAASNPVAGFSPPARESLRFESHQSLDFPETEIRALTPPQGSTSTGPWKMRLNFIGLTGSMGVLPFHYTELILHRLKSKDFSLTHFLDLFNHRICSLFYQASVKYNLPIEYERKRLFANPQKPRDNQTQALLSLIGMGTKGLNNRMGVSDESLIFYGGLFSSQVRTASGLKQILESYFDVPVRLREFVGQWQELLPDMRTQLASRIVPKGQNACLGRSVMLGSKGWFAQGKIKIVIGPLNQEQFHRFAPGTSTLKTLNELVRMYVGIERDYDFVIQVKRKDVPRQISFGKAHNPTMGWNTWLSSTKRDSANDDDTLDIVVSANRLK